MVITAQVKGQAGRQAGKRRITKQNDLNYLLNYRIIEIIKLLVGYYFGFVINLSLASSSSSSR